MWRDFSCQWCVLKGQDMPLGLDVEYVKCVCAFVFLM